MSLDYFKKSVNIRVCDMCHSNYICNLLDTRIATRPRKPCNCFIKKIKGRLCHFHSKPCFAEWSHHEIKRNTVRRMKLDLYGMGILQRSDGTIDVTQRQTLPVKILQEKYDKQYI